MPKYFSRQKGLSICFIFMLVDVVQPLLGPAKYSCSAAQAVLWNAISDSATSINLIAFIQPPESVINE